MIEVIGLSKWFGPLRAVDDVSFTLGRGEVLGFLGPNGAGKTTAMRMITGFLAPSAGTAIVCGADVRRDPLAVKRRIGYLPEGAPAYAEMTPGSFLTFIAGMRGFAGREAKRRVGLAVERANLAAVLHQPIETLSKGFKRRVCLAQALLHDPEVLVLDEPTDGLDPNQKRDIRALIQQMAGDKAIIISTHLLDEVGAICTRAVIIVGGRLCADGTPSALAARSRWHNAVRLVLAPEQEASACAALEPLPQVAGIEPIDDADGHAVVVFARDGAAILDDVTAVLRSGGWAPRELRAERGRLDDVFRSVTLGGPAAVMH